MAIHPEMVGTSTTPFADHSALDINTASSSAYVGWLCSVCAAIQQLTRCWRTALKRYAIYYDGFRARLVARHTNTPNYYFLFGSIAKRRLP